MRCIRHLPETSNFTVWDQQIVATPIHAGRSPVHGVEVLGFSLELILREVDDQVLELEPRPIGQRIGTLR